MDVEPAPQRASGSNAEAKPKSEPQQVPRSKGHRPWKQTKTRPAAAQRRTMSLKLTLEQKNKKRQEREALMRVVKAAKAADAAQKEAERERRLAKKKLKEENEIRGTQKLLITNPKKLARMSKKQYQNYLRKNNLKKSPHSKP